MLDKHQIYSIPRQRPIVRHNGITQEQAMEVFRQYIREQRAIPYIEVDDLNLSEVNRVLEGKIWPGVANVWQDWTEPTP